MPHVGALAEVLGHGEAKTRTIEPSIGNNMRRVVAAHAAEDYEAPFFECNGGGNDEPDATDNDVGCSQQGKHLHRRQLTTQEFGIAFGRRTDKPFRPILHIGHDHDVMRRPQFIGNGSNVFRFGTARVVVPFGTNCDRAHKCNRLIGLYR